MKKSIQVGGQAVLEGVMMRSPGSLAVAVRRENGQISVKEDVWRSLWDKLKFLKWPFFRGSVVMVEAMVNGISALNFSAREAMTEEEREKEDAKSNSNLSLGFAMMLGLVFAIFLFKFLPHMAAQYSGVLFIHKQFTVNDLWYHVVDGGVKMCIFIAYVAVIGRMKDIQRVFMYHGAEHMAIYTVEAEEELTVENAKQKNRLHPRCGTAFLLVVIMIFIVASAVLLPFLPQWAKPGDGAPWYTHIILVLLKLPLLIPVSGIAYEFNRFAGRHTSNPIVKPLMLPGLAMQLLTTKVPTDDQLEIGLVALRTTLWREKHGPEAILPGQIETDDGDKIAVFDSFEQYTKAFEQAPVGE